MQKIMFNDKYGLTDAVLQRKKTMTRRIVTINLYNQTDWKAVLEGDYEAVVDGEGYYHDVRCCGLYQIGEEVAIAQAYKNDDVLTYNAYHDDGTKREDGAERHKQMLNSKGYRNKMFVRADLMPHRIKITGIKLERLQDISEEDIYKEGFEKQSVNNGCGNAAWHWETMLTYMDDLGLYKEIRSTNPQEAFECLIDKLSGYGTWESNPWVYAYEFELIK